MESFDKRVAEYRRQLIDFVRRRLPRSDRDMASDFVQDALLEAQERAKLLRALTPKQTYAWLVAVLKNKMANAGRMRQRRDRLNQRAADATARSVGGPVDPSPLPVDQAEHRERMRRIKTALQELTAAQRLAIVLRFYAGWTLDEIAHQTDSTRASVFRLIQRGLEHLERTGTFSIADLA
jgi:RNA polymerase sigma factor (sigma-70 family)